MGLNFAVDRQAIRLTQAAAMTGVAGGVTKVSKAKTLLIRLDWTNNVTPERPNAEQIIHSAHFSCTAKWTQVFLYNALTLQNGMRRPVLMGIKRDNESPCTGTSQTPFNDRACSFLRKEARDFETERSLCGLDLAHSA